jgi:hypothetical protein
MKYFATRFNCPDGADIESKGFDKKADAIKWGKRAKHCTLRLNQGDRPIVFQKGY